MLLLDFLQLKMYSRIFLRMDPATFIFWTKVKRQATI